MAYAELRGGRDNRAGESAYGTRSKFRRQAEELQGVPRVRRTYLEAIP